MVTVLSKGASKSKIRQALDRLQRSSHKKGVNTHKYCGTITLKEDPLVYQKRVRNEWQ